MERILRESKKLFNNAFLQEEADRAAINRVKSFGQITQYSSELPEGYSYEIGTLDNAHIAAEFIYKLYEETDPFAFKSANLKKMVHARKAAILNENVHQFLLKHKDKGYVGCFQVIVLEDLLGLKFCSIRSLYLDKSVRNLHFGMSLIVKCIELTAVYGGEQIRYFCFKDNYRTQSIYKILHGRRAGYMIKLMKIATPSFQPRFKGISVRSGSYDACVGMLTQTSRFVDLLQQENGFVYGNTLARILSSRKKFRAQSFLEDHSGKIEALRNLAIFVIDPSEKEVLGVWGCYNVLCSEAGKFYPVVDHFLLNAEYVDQAADIFKEGVFHLVNQLDGKFPCSQIWVEIDDDFIEGKPRFLNVKDIFLDDFGFVDVNTYNFKNNYK